jgi:hypothetical protein
MRSMARPEYDYLNLPHDTRVKIILVARPLFTPLAQTLLCRYEHGVLMNKTCVHSQAILRIKIVCYYS